MQMYGLVLVVVLCVVVFVLVFPRRHKFPQLYKDIVEAFHMFWYEDVTCSVPDRNDDEPAYRIDWFQVGKEVTGDRLLYDIFNLVTKNEFRELFLDRAPNLATCLPIERVKYIAILEEAEREAGRGSKLIEHEDYFSSLVYQRACQKLGLPVIWIRPRTRVYEKFSQVFERAMQEQLREKGYHDCFLIQLKYNDERMLVVGYSADGAALVPLSYLAGINMKTFPLYR